MAVLKAGVIGAGVFGGYHAGKYAAHADTQLCAIYDVIKDAADAAAQKHGAKGFDDLDAFLSAVDIVTVASPAQTHFDMARACLLAGKPVLIEKPIAATPAQGAELVAIAKQKKLTLAVGHQERAVIHAMGLADLTQQPVKIEAVRYGPWSERGSDVSVTLDLMIHDLDLVGAVLDQCSVRKISSKGEIKYSYEFDAMQTEIEFENGAIAHLKASRLWPQRERWMKITYPSGHLYVDFVNRHFDNHTGFDLNEDFADTPEGKDPLGWNVAQFVASVRNPILQPLVTGAQGLSALKLAFLIDKHAQEA